MAQNDLLATGVIRAAEELGLRVPEDISVTGFDGIRVDGLGDHVLTTAVQPAVEKGRAVGEAVARMLIGEKGASIRSAASSARARRPARPEHFDPACYPPAPRPLSRPLK